MQKIRTLEEQREEFAQRRFIALPIAGLIAWAVMHLEVSAWMKKFKSS